MARTVDQGAPFIGGWHGERSRRLNELQLIVTSAVRGDGTDLNRIDPVCCGLYIYTRTLPEIQIATIQWKVDPSLSAAEHIQTLDLLYFGAISLMVLGGLLSVSGLVGRFQASVRDRLKTASQPKRR